MTEKDLVEQGWLSHTREWWDERAATVMPLPEVVGVGKHALEPGTQTFLEGAVVGLLERAAAREVCLDAGCGVGLAFPTLLKVFRNVVGLDFSSNILQRIPEELSSSPRVKLYQGSLSEIPLEDSSVDAVFCRDTFQCLPTGQVLPAFAEFRRVLRPGGVVVVHFKNNQHFLYRLGVAKARVRSLGRASADPLASMMDRVESERYVPGDIYLRPWSWYTRQCEAAGLRVEGQFSWQMFFWGRLKRYGLEKTAEKLERVARRTPLVERLIRHDGINYYLQLRKEA